MDILSRVSREIGFDFVRDYEQVEDRSQLLTTVPFAEWDDPYFPAATPGSIAARYYELLHQCYPLPRDDEVRTAQIAEITQYLIKEGKRGANQMSLAVAGFDAGAPDNAAVQELASALIAELAQYDSPGRERTTQEKAGHKRSPER